MSVKDKPFNAHYRCTWCHALKPKAEMIHHLGKPYCCEDHKRKDGHGFNVDRAQISALGSKPT